MYEKKYWYFQAQIDTFCTLTSSHVARVSVLCTGENEYIGRWSLAYSQQSIITQRTHTHTVRRRKEEKEGKSLCPAEFRKRSYIQSIHSYLTMFGGVNVNIER